MVCFCRPLSIFAVWFCRIWIALLFTEAVGVSTMGDGVGSVGGEGGEGGVGGEGGEGGAMGADGNGSCVCGGSFLVGWLLITGLAKSKRELGWSPCIGVLALLT